MFLTLVPTMYSVPTMCPLPTMWPFSTMCWREVHACWRDDISPPLTYNFSCAACESKEGKLERGLKTMS